MKPLYHSNMYRQSQRCFVWNHRISQLCKNFCLCCDSTVL